ncbi:MAG: S8 family serine peptidase [Rhodospirillales bacterium]
MCRVAAFVIYMIASAAAGKATAAADGTIDQLRSTVVAVCEHGLSDAGDLASPIGPHTGIEDRGAVDTAFYRTVTFGDGYWSASVQLTAFAGTLRRVRGELSRKFNSGAMLPVLLIDAAGDCAVMHGRRLEYGNDDTVDRLVHLGPDLTETGGVDVLDPPLPDGRDPGGIAVAHIDSGVNYELAHIAERLARDAEGRILGFDFWDMDGRPFDFDTSRSPFFPIRHGTAVASILLREAPGSRLIPFRYPRPDMSRMADIVEAVAAAGARIVMMPLGSRSADEWSAFANAARRHPGMLFVVSAGNEGRNIDEQPLYPASFELENLVVVTSSDGFGRLAPGSNWGTGAVDLMVPGEKVPTTDHRGATVNASGSSFAVPRIAALSARLLARHPDWQAPELIEALKARSGTPMERGGSPVRWGWIPNPADDG